MFSTTTLLTLQGFSSIATIITGISIVFVALQVAASFSDIRIRSKRESALVALQQADRFAQEIIPAMSDLDAEVKKLGVKLERRKLKTFTRPEFDEFKSNREEYRKLLPLFNEIAKNDTFAGKVISIQNKLEAIAISFISGVGDESVVYASLANTYCGFIEQYCFAYCIIRKPEEINISYEATFKLYHVWSDRLKHKKLKNQIHALTTELGRTSDESIKVTGV